MKQLLRFRRNHGLRRAPATAECHDCDWRRNGRLDKVSTAALQHELDQNGHHTVHVGRLAA